MAIKAATKPLLALFLLFSLILVSTLAVKDPELKQCRHQCKVQRQFTPQQEERCRQDCERYYREKHGRGDEEEESYAYETESEEEEETTTTGGGGSNNPYLFEDRHFTQTLGTEHGRIRFLQRFTQRSKLFRGIENYRVAILEANPQTFILPHHLDAEVIFFVARGRGAITLVRRNEKQSFNLQPGDILRIPSGTTAYAINRDNKEQLVIFKLLQTVSTPGQFEAFYGAGGENPESFFSAFSPELLQAALNTRMERVKRVFGQQRQGAIVKASEEQIRGMSHQEEGGGIWPFGGKGKGESSGDTINIFNKRPSVSNRFGRLHEVDADDYHQLRDLDVSVAFANITQGGMVLPFYNSKATKVSVVIRGEGYLEMACPHMSSETGQQGRGSQEGQRGRGGEEWEQGRGRQEGQQGRGGSQGQRRISPSYQKVSARLRTGTVFVAPPGHPVITVASQNQNLEIMCFEIKAQNNQKITLAGEGNVVSQFEREAKELAFGVRAEEVEEVFRSQRQEFFAEGPRGGGGGGRADM